MWLKRLTEYLLQHRWRAIALTFAVTFVPVIGIAGILIAAFMTLRKGWLEGVYFTLAATVPFIISFYFSGDHQGTVMPLVIWAAVGVAVLSNVLTWVFAVMLRKGSSWSTIVQIAALLGVFVVSVVHLIFPDVASWWGVQLQSYYHQAANMVSAPSEDQLEAINATKQYATGLMVTAVLFNAVLQLIIARWWEAIIFSPGLLQKELHNIRLSRLAGVLFVLSLVLSFSYWANGVDLDIMPVVYVLFAVAGLSLVHFLFGLMQSKSVMFWLSLVYVILIVAMPMSVMLISILALFDIWLDIRKRFNYRERG